jgi:hypothetical protein
MPGSSNIVYLLYSHLPMNLERLTEKFDASDIEWRIGRAGFSLKGQLYGTVLAYITNRAIQNRLDDVCGPANWRNEFKEWSVGGKPGVLCGISIRIGDEWVTKWDGAENTEIEPVKGGFSDAMKRAGVQWGIGRYLYNLEENFAVLDESGTYFAQGRDRLTGKQYRFRWNPPKLPDWALPPKAVRLAPAPRKPLERSAERVLLASDERGLQKVAAAARS